MFTVREDAMAPASPLAPSLTNVTYLGVVTHTHSVEAINPTNESTKLTGCACYLGAITHSADL